jgi:4-carboxymuconolactone decarboxylase
VTNRSPAPDHEYVDVDGVTSAYSRSEGLFLDERTAALVRLAALVAVGAPQSSYTAAVSSALTAGVNAEELIGTLLTVAPVVGLARTVTATPLLSLAIGYDIDAAFEAVDEPSVRSLRE